jgi:ankyrin repeat protein
MPVIALVFLCFVSFPLAGQTQEELDSDLGKVIDSFRYSRKNDITPVRQVRILLEKGANPNGLYDNKEGKTFLMEVFHIYSDNTDNPHYQMADDPQFQIADIFLEYGADLYAKDKMGRNVAYYINSSKSFNYLVSKGFRFDITDNEGISPCMYQILDREYLSAQIFDWEEKNSPLFPANFKNRKDYLTALLSQFSKRSTSVHENQELRNMDFMFRMLEAGADSSFLLSSKDGMWLIKWVIRWGKVQYIEKLLKFGVKPDAKDADGIPFIMWSTITSDTKEFSGITMLIEKGAPVNGVDKEGNTLLIYAAGNIGLVKFLLSRGADPNIQNKKGETALMKSGTEEIIDALLASGANPNLQDKEGKTALMHLAYFHPNFPLRDGVDPTIKDFNGRDALFYCRGADKSMIEYLVSKGCRINGQDKIGYTPLIYAATWVKYSGYEDTIIPLLDNGADPNIPDKDGRTALHTYLLKLKLSKYTGGKPWGEMKPETVIPAFLAAGAMPALKDEEGDSALSFVLYISKEFPDMRIFLDQMLKYTSADEIKIAKADSKKKIAEDRKDHILYSDYFKPSMKFLGASVLIGGLSVGMREGVYKDRDSENFMGPVNSVITMGGLGLFLGGLTGYAIGNDKGLSGLADLFLWGGIGLIGGVIVGCLPPVQEAFRYNSVLYYSPSALLALPGTIFLLRIWL